MWVNATSICLFSLLRIACLVSACIICIYSCCFSGVNVFANWHVPLSERLHKTPFPYNCCHHLNRISNIWELSEIYIFLSAHYWCNRWPVTDYNQSPMMFMALLSYYSMVIHHIDKHSCLGNTVNVPLNFKQLILKI